MFGRTNLKRSVIIAVFLVVMACGISAGEVIYVDGDASPGGDGSSWRTAYKYLQDALADANSSEKPVEIRVAQGVYTPDSSSAVPGGTGEREAAFGLIAGVAVWGGYGGFGEAEPNGRDIGKYETVLSGDIGGNDVGDLRDASRDDNSYHVRRWLPREKLLPGVISDLASLPCSGNQENTVSSPASPSTPC